MKTKKFDVADYLKTDEDIRGFLKEVVETGSPSDFVHALGTAARAKGMGELAKEIGVGRESLYKSLSESGNPRFDTVYKTMAALGVKFSVEAA